MRTWSVFFLVVAMSLIPVSAKASYEEPLIDKVLVKVLKGEEPTEKEMKKCIERWTKIATKREKKDTFEYVISVKMSVIDFQEYGGFPRRSALLNKDTGIPSRIYDSLREELSSSEEIELVLLYALFFPSLMAEDWELCVSIIHNLKENKHLFDRLQILVRKEMGAEEFGEESVRQINIQIAQRLFGVHAKEREKDMVRTIRRYHLYLLTSD